jgi:hypothetical protein
MVLRRPYNIHIMLIYKMYEYVIIFQDKMIWTKKWFKHVHVKCKEGSLVPVQTPHMSPHCFSKNAIG